MMLIFQIVIVLATLNSSVMGYKDKDYGKSVCDDWQECFGETVTNTDDVLCTGPQSCYGSPNIESFNSDVICSNWQSCAYADTITADGSVFCTGDQSCAFVGSNTIYGTTVHCTQQLSCQNTHVVADTVYCDGYQSCLNSDIDAGEVNCNGYQSCLSTHIVTAGAGISTLNCDGDNSCEDSQIDGFIKVDVTGYAGIRGATITDNGLSGPVMFINLHKEDAGDGATIEFDGEAQTVVLSCELSGCRNVNLAGSGIFDVTCDGISWSVPCPNGMNPLPSFNCPDGCPSTPCACNDTPFCDICGVNNQCEQCQSGTFLNNIFDVQCLSCVGTFGSQCNQCGLFIGGSGCIDCDPGYIRLMDQTCDLVFCHQ